jgi:hypothetical protein
VEILQLLQAGDCFGQLDIKAVLDRLKRSHVAVFWYETRHESTAKVPLLKVVGIG